MDLPVNQLANCSVAGMESLKDTIGIGSNGIMISGMFLVKEIRRRPSAYDHAVRNNTFGWPLSLLFEMIGYKQVTFDHDPY